MAGQILSVSVFSRVPGLAAYHPTSNPWRAGPFHNEQSDYATQELSEPPYSKP